jgi:hypothetical protein
MAVTVDVADLGHREAGPAARRASGEGGIGGAREVDDA